MICVCGMFALSSLICICRQLRRLLYLVSDFANQERCYQDDCQNQSNFYTPPPSVMNILRLYASHRPHKLYCNKMNDI